MGIKYSLDSDYFKKIDTEDKAYWLGFALADGCVTIDKRGYKQFRFDLGMKDIDHLELFKNSLNANHPIKVYKRKHSDNCRICIGYQEFCDDLIKVGCTPNKSGRECLSKQVPADLMHHHIRGYFDGDGHIGNSSTNRKLIIVGSYQVLNQIRNKIGYPSQRIFLPKNQNIYRLNWYSKKDIYNVYNYMYRDASIFLKRKKDIFEEIYSI